MCGHFAALVKLFHRCVLTGQSGCFLLERGIRVNFGPDFSCFELCQNQIRLQMKGCTLGFQTFGLAGGAFSMSSIGVIQVTKASPRGVPQSPTGFSSTLQFCYKERHNPWHLKFSLGLSKERRKGFKDGDIHRGLASSRSTAVISQPAWSHHTAPLGSAPRAARPGPGCCRREGQVGRTPSQSPPPRPAAPRSRR